VVGVFTHYVMFDLSGTMIGAIQTMFQNPYNDASPCMTEDGHGRLFVVNTREDNVLVIFCGG
jgi:hypothetical protein